MKQVTNNDSRRRVLSTISKWHACSDWFFIVPILLGLELLYVFYGSAGRMLDQWPIYQSYYDMLAEGFRKGHLYIDYAPRPQLLAAEDPWSMKNFRYWLGDATFYEGKYYLYWGPVPALVQAAVKSVLGIDRLIGDQYMTFVAFSIATISSCLLISKMAKRLFERVPRTLVALGMITVGCVNPVLHLIATGCVYQAAISGAQAFLVTGLMFALDAIWSAHRSERSWPYLLAAGVAWGLSLSCRFSQLPAIGLLMLGTVAAMMWCKAGLLVDAAPAEQLGPRAERPVPNAERPVPNAERPVRSLVIHSLILGLPVLAFLVALLIYNKLRFDEYFEFGTTWMTTSLKFHWSTKYWAANIYAYLLQTFELNGEFPFLHQMTHFRENGVPSWIDFPEGLLMDEPVVGVLKAIPISWLGLVAVYLAVKTAVNSRGRSLSPRDRLYIVYFFGFLTIATVSAFPALGVFITTMRYLADFSHGFVLLGIFGGYSLITRAQSVRPASRRNTVSGLAYGTMSILAVVTIMFGLAFGFQGYNSHFKRFNPELYEQLVKQLSL